MTATPGLISVSGVNPSQEELSFAKTRTEAINVMTPTTQTEEKKTVEESPGDRKLTNSPRTDNTSGLIPNSKEISSEATHERKTATSERTPAVSPNNERLSILSPIMQRLPVMSPRLYIVIVGMIMLVIAMSVYALGPVSCVVVTGIGIYSLIRSYLGTKDKAD